MRRIIISLASIAALAGTGVAQAAEPRERELEKYSGLYHAVRDEHGADAVGRNIRRYGVRTERGAREPSAAEVAKSIRTLRALRSPLLVPGSPETPPAGIDTPRAGGTLSAIAACESGGDPTAVSENGTYRGKYQFDYGTWAAVGGSGDPAAAPEAEQDRRAAALYARRGAQPWPVCGR